jgi:hypothetical protein
MATRREGLQLGTNAIRVQGSRRAIGRLPGHGHQDGNRPPGAPDFRGLGLDLWRLRFPRQQVQTGAT